MAWRDGNDNIAELLKQACPPAAASPEFKANLRLQVDQQAAALAAATPKPLWQQPFVWIPAAAASAVAVALIIFFIAFQSTPVAVTTADATSVQTTAATLNGTLKSLGGSESVEVSFEWGTTTDYGNETTPELRTERGDITANLSDLSPNTTYHFRLKVAGHKGTTYGPDMQFTTGPAPPVITTSDAAKIKTTSVTLRGSLDNLGSAANVSVSFEWGLTTSYGNETTPESKTEPGKYSADLSGLAPGTTYYFRAKADGDGDPVYGSEKRFTTPTTSPSVTTNDAIGVATTSATLRGALTSLGTASSVTVSFEWGTASGSYTYVTADQARTSTGAFSADLTSLAPGSKYYYRAKADDDGHPVYGIEESFTTSIMPPSVSTNNATDVATSSATLNGDLTSLGTASSVTVSFEWGIASGSYSHTTTDQAMTASGHFSADLNGLDSGTTYYFRTKADGDGDPVYGPEKSFATLTIPPSVRSSSATEVHCTSATLNGILDSLGTADSVRVSFEWGMTTAYGNETASEDWTTAGSFYAALDGLSPNTTYHFRAKAVGDVTAIGSDMMFTTGRSLPPQTTWYLSPDKSGGQRVMYEGDTSKREGAVAVLAGHPVLWKADRNSEEITYPAENWTVHLTLSHLGGKHEVVVQIGIWDGSGFCGYGTRDFIAEGDNVGKIYHYEVPVTVAEFAVPFGGYVAIMIDVAPEYCGRIDVHVGGDSSWAKSPSYLEPTAPDVTTGMATGVEGTTAVLNGYLQALGSASSVTVYFEWGTTTDCDSEIEVGSQTSDGGFSCALAGLTPNTTYHFRTKVVGDGINYGIDMTFTTLP
jgi:phosphodiesterase/alkaline phosphatase D-like protein